MQTQIPQAVLTNLQEELEHVFVSSLSSEFVGFMNKAHKRMNSFQKTAESEQFEDSLSADSRKLSAEILKTAFLSLDVSDPVIIHEGLRYHRQDKSKIRVMTSFGPIEYVRARYRRRGSPSLFPLDNKIGLIEGYWTRRAARIALHRLCSCTPRECVRQFRQEGGMTPSVSTLIRLYEAAGKHWETVAPRALKEIRSHEPVPEEAAVVTVQIDGVMIPMTSPAETSARKQKVRQSGAVEFKEAVCATVTLGTESGDMLRTVRYGRMPEPGQVSVRQQVVDEVEALLGRRPDLKLFALADGARTNWKFFDEVFPEAEQILDYYHAVKNLSEGLAIAYGEKNSQYKKRYHELKETLLRDPAGVDKVIASFKYLCRKHNDQKLVTKLGYFRNNRNRMNYADCKARNLMIGSGLIEATNKTLVIQRMRNSGMRWGMDGGQAILNLRALNMSDRFDSAWNYIKECW